ncbi:thiamine pyrophosphate-dependent enzyme, partial [Streptosporangium sp. NPDC048047]|uniref:thiamine pyrophosphate-dependent enzyme n=1 Tax=Streptosporangium sp. NPDC048047 TaxID=3155748 RepID=UPI003414ED1B
MTVTACQPQGPPVAWSLPVDEDLRLLLLIRHFELALLRLFEAGELSGTTHTCLGQEYIPVALSRLLREDDFVLSNHRGHGHFLARYAEPYGLLAEIMGREGALCAGVGGSQHVYHRRFLSTGVQGESLPVAAGVALALRGSGALACAYIGDGTWGEGAVYEALNMA